MHGVRILRIKTEATFGCEYEIAPRYYDLYMTGDSHFVVRSRMMRNGKRGRRKADLDSAAATHFLDWLKQLKIPAAPQFMMGCDGGFTTLILGDYGGGARFRWWSAAPEGWEELDEFTGELLGVLEAALHPKRREASSDAAPDSPSIEEK